MKTKHIISWILAGLLALAFMWSGVENLVGVQMQLKNLASWSYPLWFRFPIGLSEITFAFALILFPRFRHVTIYGIFIWTFIALATHIHAAQFAAIPIPLVFGTIALVILMITPKESSGIKA